MLAMQWRTSMLSDALTAAGALHPSCLLSPPEGWAASQDPVRMPWMVVPWA